MQDTAIFYLGSRNLLDRGSNTDDGGYDHFRPQESERDVSPYHPRTRFEFVNRPISVSSTIQRYNDVCASVRGL